MINVNKFVKSVGSFWDQNNYIWEISLDFDTSDLINKFDDDTVWFKNKPQDNDKRLNFYHPDFNNVIKDKLEIFKTDLMNRFYQDANNAIKTIWHKEKEYYLKNTSLGIQIYKDLSGFYMTPHVDNHHIMFQGIINLIDNDPGTAFYNMYSDKFNLAEIFYTATGEKNKGIFFFNNLNSMHGTSPVTKNRYILYITIDIASNLPT